MQKQFSSILRCCVVLIGLAVPISVVLDNLLLLVVLLGMLFHLPNLWRITTGHPVARAAMLLFGMLFFAVFYGTTPLREAFGVLSKYRDLAFIPMFMLMLSCGSAAQRTQQAFLIAMGLALLLSYLLGFGWLTPQSWMYAGGLPDNPSIFHSYIIQSNMMAFAVFLALLHAREAVCLRTRLLWGTFALLGATNILFMLQGRTGYLILFALIGWFALTTLIRKMRAIGLKWGWRQWTGAVLAGVVATTVLYQLSPRLQARIGLGIAESLAWQLNSNTNTNNSIGSRLDYYYNSFQIVSQHPLLGVGTGGFTATYAAQIQGYDYRPPAHPHNEYLLIATQSGLIGLALLLYLFWSVWHHAPKLKSAFAQDAARGLALAYMINCAFNSALHDHSDGLLFALMTAALFAEQAKENCRG